LGEKPKVILHYYNYLHKTPPENQQGDFGGDIFN